MHMHIKEKGKGRGGCIMSVGGWTPLAVRSSARKTLTTSSSSSFSGTSCRATHSVYTAAKSHSRSARSSMLS